jgi:Ca-activated chloride channel family protein
MTPIVHDFQFLRPLWLLGLLTIPPLLWWLRRSRLRRNVWRDTVDAHLLPHLLQGGAGATGGWRAMLPAAALAIAFALSVLALAGPSWRTVPQPLWQDRNPLVIAVDMSFAMQTADVQPSRLLQARAKIAQILRTRGGGQIALVAYADDAYTVSPLTGDADNIALFLDALSPDVMPRDGSRADRAIEESARLLARAGFDRGEILLITDHPGGGANSAAVAARDSGYRVSVLGLGTAAGGAYRAGNGEVLAARLEGPALRRLAASGGGEYAAFAPDDSDLMALGVLEADRIDAAEAQGKRGAAPLDEGFWLLPPLLLLALFAFRRGVLAVALLALWLPWQPVAAAEGDTLWQRDDQRRHAQMASGVEAYRSGDYAAAEDAWRDLPGAEAAYNRGNALAKQGRLDDAMAEYDRALQLQPGMRDAVENRQRVDRARKRKPPQDNPQNKPQQKPKDKPQSGKQPPPDKPQNDQQKPGQDQPRDAGDGQKQPPKPDAKSDDKPGAAPPPDKPQGAPQPSPDPSRKPPTPEPTRDRPKDGQPDPQPSPTKPPTTPANVDPVTGKPVAPKPAEPDTKAQLQAQREADAALRERMRRAQGKTPESKPPGAQTGTQTGRDPDPKETAAERERRIANDAWLRRVPDDPGGLLRAKFKLEEKRRRRGGDR